MPPSMRSLPTYIPTRTSPPVPVWAAHDLRPVDVFALIHNLAPFAGHSILSPHLPLPCRWNHPTRRTPPWPVEAGNPPDPPTLFRILTNYGIRPERIIRQTEMWRTPAVPEIPSTLQRSPATGSHPPVPYIFLLAGQDGARAHSDDPPSTANGPGEIAPAQPLLISRCTGNCRALLICHEQGYLWATIGRDSERRLQPLLYGHGGQLARLVTPLAARALTGNTPHAAESGRPIS